MKKIVFLLCTIALFLTAFGCGKQPMAAAPVVSAPPTIPVTDDLPDNRIIRVAVTETLADSDLLQLLKLQFEQDSPYQLEFSANPNNVVVSVAQSGKADLLLVRESTEESQFVAAGYGEAIPWIRDGYVLLGTEEDQADVQSADDFAQVLQRIAESGSLFVSRYDESDVYQDEANLWKKSGITIGNGKKWYKAARLAMTASLQKANELGAYILSEKEAFLKEKDTLSLRILFENDEVLEHTYCLIPLYADAFDGINTEGASAFIDWLHSEKAASLVQTYGREQFGCPIFTMDSFYS